jgi:hypothetical protein
MKIVSRWKWCIFHTCHYTNNYERNSAFVAKTLKIRTAGLAQWHSVMERRH